MSRYIDADLLLENLKSQYGEDLGWQCTVNMSDVGMMIEDAPAADVQEVKHGRWIRATTYGSYTCSICGAMDTDCDDYFGNHRVLDQQYCPDCGAKMGGGDV